MRVLLPPGLALRVRMMLMCGMDGGGVISIPFNSVTLEWCGGGSG